MGEEDEFGGVAAEDGGGDGSGPDEWVAGSLEPVRDSPLRIGLSEAEEQRARDFWGYTKSETRTKAERDAAAARIIERLPAILAKIEAERLG